MGSFEFAKPLITFAALAAAMNFRESNNNTHAPIRQAHLTHSWIIALTPLFGFFAYCGFVVLPAGGKTPSASTPFSPRSSQQLPRPSSFHLRRLCASQHRVLTEPADVDHTELQLPAITGRFSGILLPGSKKFFCRRNTACEASTCLTNIFESTSNCLHLPSRYKMLLISLSCICT